MSQDLGLFAASLDYNIYTVDLHSAGSLRKALEWLESGLYQAHAEGHPYCKIIHGIGEGVLTVESHKLLKVHPLVKAFKLEENGGSTVVVF